MDHVEVRTSDLAVPDRQAIEHLLGRKLADHEAVSVRTFVPHQAPTGADRIEAGKRLSEVLDEMAAKVTGSTAELEELIDEVAHEVRHGRPPS